MVALLLKLLGLVVAAVRELLTPAASRRTGRLRNMVRAGVLIALAISALVIIYEYADNSHQAVQAKKHYAEANASKRILEGIASSMQTARLMDGRDPGYYVDLAALGRRWKYRDVSEVALRKLLEADTTNPLVMGMLGLTVAEIALDLERAHHEADAIVRWQNAIELYDRALVHQNRLETQDAYTIRHWRGLAAEDLENIKVPALQPR